MGIIERIEEKITKRIEERIEENTNHIIDMLETPPVEVPPVELPIQKTIDFEETTDVLKNPYRGAMHYGDNLTNDFDFELVAAYVSWKELEPTKYVFDWESFESKFNFSKWREEGKKMMIMFYMDWSKKPKIHTDIPSWLYDEIDGTYYTNSGDAYGGFSPNYKNAILISEHTRVIKAFADRYNNDDFVWLFKMGSVGHWGEMHTTFLTHGEAGSLPTVEYTSLYESAYNTYLTNKLISVRQVRRVGIDNGMGLHCDAFGHVSESNYWLNGIANGYQDWRTKSYHPAMPSAWEAAPTGGECYSSPPTWFGTESYETTLAQIQAGKCSWFRIPPQGAFAQGSIEDINFKTMLNQLGYRLYIKSITYPEFINTSADIQMTWSNTGLAPFYYDWKIELSLSSDGIIVYSKTVDVDIRTWIPGTYDISTSITPQIAPGQYDIQVSIINPKTLQPAIYLANEGDLRYIVGKIEVK